MNEAARNALKPAEKTTDLTGLAYQWQLRQHPRSIFPRMESRVIAYRHLLQLHKLTGPSMAGTCRALADSVAHAHLPPTIKLTRSATDRVLELASKTVSTLPSQGYE